MQKKATKRKDWSSNKLDSNSNSKNSSGKRQKHCAKWSLNESPTTRTTCKPIWISRQEGTRNNTTSKPKTSKQNSREKRPQETKVAPMCALYHQASSSAHICLGGFQRATYSVLKHIWCPPHPPVAQPQREQVAHSPRRLKCFQTR
jgi:hypothetical protein